MGLGVAGDDRTRREARGRRHRPPGGSGGRPLRPSILERGRRAEFQEAGRDGGREIGRGESPRPVCCRSCPTRGPMQRYGRRLGERRLDGGQPAQATERDRHLRRPPHTPRGRPRRPGKWSRSTEPLGKPLRGRSGGRVPGHGSGAVADPRQGVPRIEARTDRRSEAGDIRVPWRRCIRVPERRPDRADAGDTRGQLAIGRGLGQGPRCGLRRGPTGPGRHCVTTRCEAAPENQGSGISGAPCGTPLRVRLVDRAEMGVAKGFPSAPGARDRIARDLAAEVRELLSSGAEIADPRGNQTRQSG